MNLFQSITIIWVPGHCGISGNYQADRMAKQMITGRINYGRCSKLLILHRAAGAVERQLRGKEMMEWCAKEGHDYYQPKFTKPRFLKGLSRMDNYVFNQIRTGSDNVDHEDCDGFNHRFHLIKCPRYSRNTPAIDRLFKDKLVMKWVNWIRENNFLNMVIPTTTREHLEIQVVYVNPFDHTTMVERNRERIWEPTLRKGCDGCGFSHQGNAERKSLY